MKPVDRTTNEKMRAESARLKSEKSAKKLSDLIEKVKIKHLAATKIKLNNVHLDIGKDESKSIRWLIVRTYAYDCIILVRTI